jgi:hypothetical protein
MWLIFITVHDMDGLSHSCTVICYQIGILLRVLAGGLVPNHGNSAWWFSEEAKIAMGIEINIRRCNHLYPQ